MKLANLFLITALVGVMAAIGCSDDPPQNGTGGSGGTAGSGGTGTGGSGGTVTDTCTGGFCDESVEAKTACGLALEFCKGPDCCAGIDPKPTDEQCDSFGPKICTLDFGGAGGAGGDGGDGGAGGDGGGDNPTADEVCDEHCDSTDAGRIQDCKDTYDACLLNPPSGGDPGEKCSVIGLAQCGVA